MAHTGHALSGQFSSAGVCWLALIPWYEPEPAEEEEEEEEEEDGGRNVRGLCVCMCVSVLPRLGAVVVLGSRRAFPGEIEALHL